MPGRINFNRALIISFLWHILCFFMFTIVIVPAGAGHRRLSKVSFLGSILDNSSFSRDSGAFESSSAREESRKDRFFPSLEVAEPGEREFQTADKDYFLNARPYKTSVDEIMAVRKAQPLVRDEVDMLQAKRETPEIEGEASGRTIIFKPPVPGVIKKDDISTCYKIKLKLVISADGNVKSVENLQTSGYPELDLAATRYVKKWKFAPLTPDRPQYDQEGMVLLELKLDMGPRLSFKENDVER